MNKWVDLVRNQWDRAAAWVAAGSGALALLLGYLGISSTPYTPEQLPYLVSGGAFGLFLLGLAAVLWLTADLRDEWRKLDDIDDHLAELVRLAEADAAVREVVARASLSPEPAAAMARMEAPAARAARSRTGRVSR